jgi:nitrogen fixation-related uncharacterized protein
MGREIPGACASRKGQSEIMEYILVVVFIVAAIMAIIFFLAWWNVQQFQMDQFKNQQDRIVGIGQYMMADYMFTNGDSMFDDAKLTSINASVTCEELQRILGSNWYVKITALDMEGERPCRWNDYPDCNVWSMCGYLSNAKSSLGQNFPINVYRKSSDKVALAILHVEVYS